MGNALVPSFAFAETDQQYKRCPHAGRRMQGEGFVRLCAKLARVEQALDQTLRRPIELRGGTIEWLSSKEGND